MASRNYAARTILAAAIVLTAGFAACAKRPAVPDILVGKGASWHERVAAKEIRRYLYLRTGGLAAIREVDSSSRARANAILVVQKGAGWLSGPPDAAATGQVAALGDQDYLLKTLALERGPATLVAGGSGPAVLYGAYRLAEKLGVRFALEGDVVPDIKAASLAISIDETGHPLFPVRGIQPFHDFPEGPDWWDRENYKAVLGQLPKLRMNFFGLHTYPENPSKAPGATPNAEPTVWIGRESDFSSADGRVLAAYPASYQNTARGNWGYEAKKTSEFHFGASLLFDRDDYGNDVMEGFSPGPKTPDDQNAVFNRAADVFRDGFGLARKLGIKTCVGAETALTIPEMVRERLQKDGRGPKDPAAVKDVYKGIFGRIAKAYPADYYWFWTNENWTWSDASPEEIRAVTTDLAMAVEAWKEIAPPFSLATCGWVLGPPSNRTLFDQVLPKSVAMSCINREVGKAPVDPGFSRITGRSLWAIPWMEDDPALTSPQLWAGRMRRDAADALRYGCDGLLGIHWRTRILSANVQALAEAAWEQPWNKLAKTVSEDVGPITGQYVSFQGVPIAGAYGYRASPIYSDVRDRVFAYHIPVPNGTYTVTLKFVEGQIEAKRGRVFDVFLQGRKVIDSLDIFARVGKYRMLDFIFDGVAVADGRLTIDFADRIHYPAIAAIAIEGPGFKKRINCGGPAVDGFEADWPQTPRFLPTQDFYRDWAASQFGPRPGPAIAEIFSRIDGVHPVPATWIGGPGNIQPDPRPWEEVRKGYAFVDELRALGPQIEGPGCRERFSYWLMSLDYMREVARFNCLWARYNAAMDMVKAGKTPEVKAKMAKEDTLPIRAEMATALRGIFDRLLATVSTTGELGTVANWEQHILPGAWERPEGELKAVLGGELPSEVVLSRDYAGDPRIIVPALRTSLEPGEALDLKVIILSRKPPEAAELYWREMGRGRFRAIPLKHVARGVFGAVVPAGKMDLEYYIKVKADGRDVFFPPTAPGLNQTVIVN